ncbi:hypothetical protein OAN96_01215 [Candidatus Gracilibacteria bacterium]|nr:hypothetical protein [Candidatus Gracilibacteria bacterium]
MTSILFLKYLGFTDIDIGTTQFIWGIFIFSLEIPTGRFADKIGYRLSIILSYLSLSLLFVSFIVAIFLGKYIVFLGAGLFLGLSKTLLSGAGNSYLYTIFRHDNKLADFNTYKIKISRNSQIIKGVATLVGVYLYNIAEFIPYTLQAILVFGAFVASLYLQEAPTIKSLSTYDNIQRNIKDFFSQKIFILLLLFIVLVTTPHEYFHGVINQSLFLETGIDLTYLGIVGVTIYIISALVIHFMRDIWIKYGEFKSYTTLAILVIFAGIGFLLSTHPIWIILCSCLLYSSRELFYIFIDNSFQFRIKSDHHRATLISIFSMFYELLHRTTFIFIGMILIGYSYTYMMFYISVFFGVLSLIFLQIFIKKSL